MTKFERLQGCMLGGAIGDAIGSCYENQTKQDNDTFYPFGEPEQTDPLWQITDDTQLTVVTIKALIEDIRLPPKTLAKHFITAYSRRNIRGIGASTLKALQELEVGGHWSQVGRRGEFAAGNGAAMRIAPLAFLPIFSRQQIRDICSITHRNDEAYVGALAVFLAIQEILSEHWNINENLIQKIIPQLPDSKVKDRMVQVSQINEIAQIGKLGNSGYVVDTIPLALAAANQIADLTLDKIFDHLISVGGDTDTICSITGQIIGCQIGIDGIPPFLINKLALLPEYDEISSIIQQFGRTLKYI